MLDAGKPSRRATSCPTSSAPLEILSEDLRPADAGKAAPRSSGWPTNPRRRARRSPRRRASRARGRAHAARRPRRPRPQARNAPRRSRCSRRSSTEPTRASRSYITLGALGAVRPRHGRLLLVPAAPAPSLRQHESAARRRRKAGGPPRYCSRRRPGAAPARPWRARFRACPARRPPLPAQPPRRPLRPACAWRACAAGADAGAAIARGRGDARSDCQPGQRARGAPRAARSRPAAPGKRRGPARQREPTRAADAIRRSLPATPPTRPATWRRRAAITSRRCATSPTTAMRCSAWRRSKCARSATTPPTAITARCSNSIRATPYAQAGLIALRGQQLDPRAGREPR